MESRKTVVAALIFKRLKWLYSISDDLTKVLFGLYMTIGISFGLNCESHSPYFHVLYIPLKCRTVFILFDSRSSELDLKSGIVSMVSMERNNSMKLFLWYVISKKRRKTGIFCFYSPNYERGCSLTTDHAVALSLHCTSSLLLISRVWNHPNVRLQINWKYIPWDSVSLIMV